MSQPDNTSPTRNGGVKTLAIRLEPDLHLQLTLMADLLGNTITDEIRTAIDERITKLKTQPDLIAKADQALESIDRDAAARRGAIATLFGDSTAQSATAEPEGTPATQEPPATRPASATRARSKTGPKSGGTST